MTFSKLKTKQDLIWNRSERNPLTQLGHLHISYERNVLRIHSIKECISYRKSFLSGNVVIWIFI